MKWEKKGLIFCPKEENSDWAKCFAMLPTPLLIDGDTLRIYLGMCDYNNVGRLGYIDVKADDPKIIQNISEKPVLDVGRRGAFDDNGVVPISIQQVGKEIFLYYIGFQLGVQIPYYMFCGLAISNDNGNSFERYSNTPILDRTSEDLYARCGVNVIRDESKWKMYYIGSKGNGWTEYNGKKLPLYTMKYIESNDGIHWNEFEPIEIMKYESTDEYGFGRPFVFKEDNVYKMYYSIRTYSKGYYIGYAESINGIKWERKDHCAKITTSIHGWDSENISYPYIYRHKEKTYMFYNGNGCGRTGFGYAELKK